MGWGRKEGREREGREERGKENQLRVIRMVIGLYEGCCLVKCVVKGHKTDG